MLAVFEVPTGSNRNTLTLSSATERCSTPRGKIKNLPWSSQTCLEILPASRAVRATHRLPEALRPTSGESFKSWWIRHPGSPGPAQWLTIKLHRRGDGEVLRIRSRRLRNSASTGRIDSNRLRSSISCGSFRSLKSCSLPSPSLRI
jgi:hypothetical protein